MKKFTHLLLFFLSILTSVTVQASKEPRFINNEYLIEDAENMFWLAEKTNAGNDFKGVNFRIKSYWIGAYNQNWTPIGTEEHPFRGNFDGNGHCFNGLTIHSDLPYVGLFGYVEEGVIKNLSIKDYRIITEHPQGYAGVIAGYSDAVIINCASIGGDEWWSHLSAPYCAGGLVGKADNAIYNSQARNLHKIEKANFTGGIVGESNSLVADCFSNIKKLNGRDKGHMVAKLNKPGKLHDNFRNKEWHAAEDNSNSKDGARLDVAKFTTRLNQNRSKYFAYQPLAEWNDNGLQAGNQDSGNTETPFSGKGSGTELDPFTITNAQQLTELANVVNQQLAGYTTAYYKIMNDIDLTGVEWQPIGKNASAPFKGQFDGNFKEISNLCVKSEVYFGGLFGYVREGSVKYTALHNVDVLGVKDVGHNVTYIAGLIGYAQQANVEGNIIYGNIEVNRNGGNNTKDMARVIGMFDNGSTVKGNYATGDLIGYEEGHNHRDGETITLFDNSQTVIMEGNRSYLLQGDFSSLTVEGENVILFCRNNVIDGKLSLNATTTQRGTVTTGALEFTETTNINPEGINNLGEIIMKRQPATWTEASGTGWETICLPFDANVYADGKLIAPITKTSKGAYWLREFVEPANNDSEGYVYFASYENAIEPNDFAIRQHVPYILSFPGDRYGVNSLKKKQITYRGYGEVKLNSTNPKLTHEKSDYVFEGHFLTTEKESCYVLNNNGSSFELHPITIVNPFCAVLRTKSSDLPVIQALRIATGSNQPTSMTDGTNQDDKIFAYASDGILYISTDTPGMVQVHHATTGIMVAEVYVSDNTATVNGLPKGIYLVNREKVVIY
ncbi:MAG: hypothetical protein RRZ66_05110 [Bacteroidales bacterium]